MECTPSVASPAAVRPSWFCAPGRESTQMNRQVCYLMGKKESFSVCWDYINWVWGGPGALSKRPINSTDCRGLWMCPHPLVRQTDLLVQHLHLCLATIQFQRGRGGMLIPLAEHCINPMGCEAVTSWLASKQAYYVLQFIKLNV